LGPVLETAGPDAGDLTARLAVRFIHDNLNRPLGVSEIANQVHTSVRHLSRLFERFTGTSPAAYLTQARLDRACGLLAHSQAPIKEIAEAVGYPDVHHFTRVFAQRLGCPPGEYRRHPNARAVPNIQKPGALV
jgi:transcriptional regulator GlxA family with amidase domain